MNKQTALLIKMINKKKTLKAIRNELKLSDKELFERLSMLRDIGYSFDGHYNYYGDITYSFSNQLTENNHNDDNSTNISDLLIPNDPIHIDTPNNLKYIRAMLTSDTHFGHIDERLRCIHNMTDYCVNNGIHIVFNAGDFFEGFCTGNKPKFNDPYKLINYGLENYPYDKNILTFLLLGNHDISFCYQHGIDLRKIFQEERPDIVPVGYGRGDVFIGNYKFKMRHKINNKTIKINLSENDSTSYIMLKGHSHNFKVLPGGHRLIVSIPSLSSVSPSPIPEMLEMKLDIKDGMIKREYFQHFIFQKNDPVRIGEISYDEIIYPQDKITRKLKKNK